MPHFNLITLPIIISFVITTTLGIYASRQRQTHLAQTFSILMLATSIWIICYFFGLSSPTLTAKIFWLRFKHLGSATTPVIWFIFSLQFTKRSHWLKNRLLGFSLAAFVFLTWVVVFSSDYHGLMWNQVWIKPGFPEEEVIHGLYYWFYLGITYFLVVASSIIYIHFFIQSPTLYRKQALTMVIGSLVPLLGSIPFVFFGLDMVPFLDETILFFLVSDLFFSWSIFRFRSLDIIPIAHHMIVQKLMSGIIVLDHASRVIEINPVAEQIFDQTPDQVIGKPAKEVLIPLAPVFRPRFLQNERGIELSLGSEDNLKYYLVNNSPIQDQKGRFSGNVLLITDITQRKLTEIQLQVASISDDLTKAYNRGHFFHLAEMEHSRAQRYKKPMTIMIMDLDHFKDINDTYGHLIGDQVIKSVADNIKNNIRKSDIFARYGGEEFVCLFPEISYEDAIQAAEKIRKTIEDASVVLGAFAIKTTISAGVYYYHSDHPTLLLDCVARADQAMYISKQQGRNRITVWNQALNRMAPENDDLNTYQ